MTNRPICPKGQRKTGSPCIFCQDGSYCAHQYYCPSTRQYENTGWRECRRMPHPSGTPPLPPSPKGEGFGNGQEVNKEVKSVSTTKEEVKKEVKSSGAKKTNRRKPRKG